ncbi:alanine racemase [Mesorhizobium sp. L-8-10]|uniref:alanine racemase n=1 Tax=Mesorhizobium sp. L-8-10 TaxID=2744523 RepID=UPI0019264E1A|nr:alanine racemase [Mesorhizobium sp. L-8-10]BCH33504.1 alanine racemase [Mesorhizobium sp. L-8-10]
MNTPFERAGAVLTVDLEAIASNYTLLRGRLGGTECSAVVKADAYGLGAVEVASALRAAGCRSFFVAHVEEGLVLREGLPHARILVLNGMPAGTEEVFLDAGLVPVINSLRELAAWRERAVEADRKLPAALQLDSGMSRLGLASREVELLAADRSLLEPIEVVTVLSHLACADEPDHPANGMQRREFDRLRALLPPAPASLANSSGIFLGTGFHYDLARPGAALYGINPTPRALNPMRPVVNLSARVLQLRDVPAQTGIGYGHTARAAGPMRLATISLGYADGWHRHAAAAAFLDGLRLPFIGRVSMDSIILDATECRKNTLHEGALVDLICPEQTIDQVASATGTIGYEVLTSLGRRYHRRYLGAAA